MALVGNTFYQDSSVDPGVGYPMYYWHQTNTGLVYIRNSADTAWKLVGDSAQDYLGQLSRQGGNMNGAISGAHGLSAADSNDFSGTLRQGGNEVALKTYVDAQIAAMNGSVSGSLASALASMPSMNLAARVAWNKGIWSFNGTSTGNIITPPRYTDGVMAQESECLWGAYFVKITGGLYQDKNYFYTITETSNRVFDITAHRGSTETDFATNYDAKVAWFILAFRST